MTPITPIDEKTEEKIGEKAYEKTCQGYIKLLSHELVCALGCTEPIALAYASALATRVLSTCEVACEHIDVQCSGNIIKNVKSVAVPNAEGLKGVEAAATLGVCGGNPDAKLEVLQSVTHEHVDETRRLISAGFCTVKLIEGVPNLYIIVTVTGHDSAGAFHEASVTVADRHTNVTQVTCDGHTLSRKELERICPAAIESDDSSQCREDDKADAGADSADGICEQVKSSLTIASIVAFARTVRLDDVRPILERQIECNSAIADEGLAGHWGSQIGRTILASRPVDVLTRMRARAAAGSDARMGGCSLPVVINSGSGNQGITVSVPVIEYAHAIHASHEDLLRALCVSNLTALHLKHYIGSLSAFCGVVCAAAGSGAAITFLAGGSVAQIGSTVVNTIANVGGIMCDGAKASCAAKIASAVDAAMLGHQMAMLDEDFCAGDGLVSDDVETTIMSMGYVGRVGMKDTDVEILKIMIGQTGPEDMRC